MTVVVESGLDGPEGAPPVSLPPAGKVDPGKYWTDGRLPIVTVEVVVVVVVPAALVLELAPETAPAPEPAPAPAPPKPVKVEPAGRVTEAELLVPCSARTTVLDPAFPLASV